MLIPSLRKFCKSTKILGIPLHDLYKKFSEKNSVSRADFELGMLELKKRPALILKVDCCQYYQDNKEFGYQKFCTEQTFVTKEFWDEAISDVVDLTDEQRYFSEKMPENWGTLQWVDKERFIKKQKNLKFLKFIISLGITEEILKKVCLKKYEELSGSKYPEEQSVLLRLSPEDQVSPPPQVLNEVLNLVEKKIEKPVKKKKRVVFKTTQDVNGFYKLLPANWAFMDKAERVEFVQRIQHDEFREYVLSLDSDLNHYYLQLKPKATKLKLYVTLFQFPVDDYTEDSKKLLKKFIENLNAFGRANLQYVECTDPHVIEIREVR